MPMSCLDFETSDIIQTIDKYFSNAILLFNIANMIVLPLTVKSLNMSDEPTSYDVKSTNSEVWQLQNCKA